MAAGGMRHGLQDFRFLVRQRALVRPIVLPSVHPGNVDVRRKCLRLDAEKGVHFGLGITVRFFPLNVFEGCILLCLPELACRFPALEWILYRAAAAAPRLMPVSLTAAPAISTTDAPLSATKTHAVVDDESSLARHTQMADASAANAGGRKGT